MPELTTPAILSPAHRVKWEKENTMAEYLNTVSIPVIVTIVYCAIDLIKTTIAPYQSLSERLSHFYPLLAVALGIMFATRYVSLGSIAGLALFPVYALIDPAMDWPLRITALFLATLVIVMHRANICRLLNGTENRIDPGKLSR